MSGRSFADWLSDRSPEVPQAFLSYLLEGRAGEGRVDPGSLMEAGMARMEKALEGEGRRAAFDLLVADALLTYACEEAARATDVGLVLEGLFRILGARFD